MQLQSPTHDLVYKLRFAVGEPLLTHSSFGLLRCLLDRCYQFLVLFVLLGVLVDYFGHDCHLLLFPDLLQNRQSVLLQLDVGFEGVLDPVHCTI